jgi:predicted AAA+ superfamily ATPase
MILREIRKILKEYADSFRSVLLVGPRQSGKTTLAKYCFPKKPYVSLENMDERALAIEDPRAFLNPFYLITYRKCWIILIKTDYLF